MTFFNENIRELAQRFYEKGDNGAVIHDALLDLGFSTLAKHFYEGYPEGHESNGIGCVGCPTAYLIVNDMAKQMHMFDDVMTRYNAMYPENQYGTKTNPS